MAIAAPRLPVELAQVKALLDRFGGLAPLAVEIELVRRGLEPRADVVLVARRHISAGQRAMVVAKLYPEPEVAHRGKKGSVAERFPMVHKGSLSIARQVIEYAPNEARP